MVKKKKVAPPLWDSSIKDPDPVIKVTFLGKVWGCRLFFKNELHSESIAETKLEIGPVCRDLLRWFDKIGGCSLYASRARHRTGEKLYGKKQDSLGC